MEITLYQGMGTAAKEIYSASGMLETKQETIHATRNGKVVITNVQDSTSTTSTQSGGWSSTASASSSGNWSGGRNPTSPNATGQVSTNSVTSIGTVSYTHLTLPTKA